MASAQTSAGQPPADEPTGAQPAHEPRARSLHGGRGALRRYPDRGLLGGVGAGLAEQFGLDVLMVRIVMAMAVAAGGVAVPLYALGWALIPVAHESEGVGRPRGAWREAVLILLVVAGVLFGLRRAGLLIGDSFVWPLILGTAGLALVWRPSRGRTDEGGPRPSLRALLRHPAQIDLPRLVLGVLLSAFAAASLLHALGVLHSLG